MPLQLHEQFHTLLYSRLEWEFNFNNIIIIVFQLLGWYGVI